MRTLASAEKASVPFFQHKARIGHLEMPQAHGFVKSRKYRANGVKARGRSAAHCRPLMQRGAIQICRFRSASSSIGRGGKGGARARSSARQPGWRRTPPLGPAAQLTSPALRQRDFEEPVAEDVHHRRREGVAGAVERLHHHHAVGVGHVAEADDAQTVDRDTASPPVAGEDAHDPLRRGDEHQRRRCPETACCRSPCARRRVRRARFLRAQVLAHQGGRGAANPHEGRMAKMMMRMAMVYPATASLPKVLTMRTSADPARRAQWRICRMPVSETRSRRSIMHGRCGHGARVNARGRCRGRESRTGRARRCCGRWSWRRRRRLRRGAGTGRGRR